MLIVLIAMGLGLTGGILIGEAYADHRFKVRWDNMQDFEYLWREREENE